MVNGEILNKIKESNNIAITFHTSPDGDSLGSALGLLQGLRKLNKKVYILSKEPLPKTFTFLPCSEEITGESYEVLKNTDLVIVLDCGNVERINAQIEFSNRQYTIINIDHHISNENYGDFNFVNSKAAAVSEIIYDILCKLSIEIDKDIATCLYTSLLTDTGSFRYSSTSYNTHKVAGELINTGFDFSEIHRKIYENKEFIRLKLYGRALDTLYMPCSKFAVIKITNKMLEELNLEKAEDTSDVVSLAMQLKDIEAAVLFKEAEEGVKLSFRSKKYLDVRRIAEHFGGGGHIRAAGGYIKGKNLGAVEKEVVEYIKKELI